MQSPERTTADIEDKLAELQKRFPAWRVEQHEIGYQAFRHVHERDRSFLGIVQAMVSGSLVMLEWRLEHQEQVRREVGL